MAFPHLFHGAWCNGRFLNVGFHFQFLGSLQRNSLFAVNLYGTRQEELGHLWARNHLLGKASPVLTEYLRVGRTSFEGGTCNHRERATLTSLKSVDGPRHKTTLTYGEALFVKVLMSPKGMPFDKLYDHLSFMRLEEIPSQLYW